jgi:hypothetical protein
LYNTQTNDLFNSAFAISQMSQTGNFLAFTSDWDNTLGTTDVWKKWSAAGTYAVGDEVTERAIPYVSKVTNNTVEPATDINHTYWMSQWTRLGISPVGSLTSPQACYGGNTWQPNYAPALGELVHPDLDMTGGGMLYSVFQAVAIGNSNRGRTQSGHPNVVIPTLFANKTIGETSLDGDVTWMMVSAKGNCATDIYVVNLR